MAVVTVPGKARHEAELLNAPQAPDATQRQVAGAQHWIQVGSALEG